MKNKIYKFTAIISICAMTAGCSSADTQTVSDTVETAAAAAGNTAVTVSTEMLGGEIKTTDLPSGICSVIASVKRAFSSVGKALENAAAKERQNTVSSTSSSSVTTVSKDELFSDRDLEQTTDTRFKSVSYALHHQFLKFIVLHFPVFFRVSHKPELDDRYRDRAPVDPGHCVRFLYILPPDPCHLRIRIKDKLG